MPWRVSACLTSVLALLSLLLRAAEAQAPRARVRAASVTIMLQADNRARVEARYEFAGNPGALSFELLQQRCALLGPIRAQANGRDISLASEATGPWLRLHETSAVEPGSSALGYTFAYDVELHAADASIPVLLPLTVLRAERRGEHVASVTVQLPSHAGVTLPRMTRAADGHWSTRMAALPSAVRVHGLSPNVECEALPDAESGRFKLIFWSLVATLALWVPAYLWWANRQQRSL
jgi:hypothetical protein